MSADREGDSFDHSRFDGMDGAVRAIIRSTPNWLAELIEGERATDEYRIAAYFLKSLDFESGAAMWARTRDRLFDKVAADRQAVLIECIARFGSDADAGILAEHARSDHPWVQSALAALCDINPDAALDLLEACPPLSHRPSRRGWLDRLLDFDEARTRAALSAWHAAADSTGGALASLYTRALDRVDDALIADSLSNLALLIAAPFEEGARDPFTSLVNLLGSLTLDPRHNQLFEIHRGTVLAQHLCQRAINTVDGQKDERHVAVRRILRRIGGADYERLLLHALSHNDLGKARSGIAMSIFAPSPHIISRLEELTEVGTSEGDAVEVRLTLWRILLAVAPSRWRPRLMALVDGDNEEDVAFALRLLPEYEEADDQARYLCSLSNQVPGSAIEAMLINAAAVAGPSNAELTNRALARLADPDDQNGRLGALNTLLIDRAPKPRAVLDSYLAKLGSAKSWSSTDSEALVIRLGQGGASEELWAIGERVGGRGLWSDDDFVGRLVDKDEAKALNILLERAFSEPDFITNVQPAAIETLARIDKGRATQAFRQAWISFPDRRRHLARSVQTVEPSALEAMVDVIGDVDQESTDRLAYRAACVELRRGHKTVQRYLIRHYASGPLSRKEALLEAIGWMPNGPQLLTEIIDNERDRSLRDRAYEARRVWLDATAAAEQFRAMPSLDMMEFALDVCEPEPTFMLSDPLRIIDLIRLDPRLTYYAEQQLARRLNERTKSNLRRVTVRARRTDCPN